MLARIAIVAAVALATVTGVQAGTHLPSPLRDVVGLSDAAAGLARQEALVARDYAMPWPSSAVQELSEEFDADNPQAPMAGTFGVDVSQPVSTAGFKCIKSKGYKFAVIRIFQQTCHVDPNGRKTAEDAWAGGMEHVDLYLFPSYGCSSSAATQVDHAINGMGTTKFGTLWLDIEAGGQKDHAFNHRWMTEAVAQAKKRLGAKRVGIYSSRYEWGLVMGTAKGPTDLPLWYAAYDGHPSFANFGSFGGWSHPSMKQFAGDASMCGAGVDLNWY